MAGQGIGHISEEYPVKQSHPRLALALSLALPSLRLVFRWPANKFGLLPHEQAFRGASLR